LITDLGEKLRVISVTGIDHDVSDLNCISTFD